MTKKEYDNLPNESKMVFDGVHLIIRLAHFAYEKALEEGFTPAQSLEMCKAYMSTFMSMGVKK